MQTKKMSLANIKGKLSRAEMKTIMAGSNAICICADGSEAGVAGCSLCDGYCRDKGGQASTSECN